MKREFHLQDDRSNKFWTIEVVGNDVVTTHGRIGAKPRETRKAWPETVPMAIASAIRPATTNGPGPRSMRRSKVLSHSRITHQATGQAIRLAMITGFENCQASN